MNKHFFMNDYGEGAHPLIMQRLVETNLEHTCGYGMDDYSLRAQKLLIEKVGQPQAQVHMMAGGTSANMIAISAFLRPYEGVIAADSGHINVHETGAVEGSGHKVLVAKSKDGKVLPLLGYTVEAWDGSAWGEAERHSGSSYTYTAGTDPAKVRLTWKWDGMMVILR